MEAVAMTQRNAATVERLREEIRKLQAAPRQHLFMLRTRLEQVDALLPGGGFLMGEAVELCGEAASGRTSLALRVLASAHREARLCAYVDGPGELYPPAATALGVELSRLLIVRPPAPKQLVWSAVQLLRSGAFACVVLDLTHTGLRLNSVEARKLQEAASKGQSLLLLLTPPDAPADGLIRLEVHAQGVEGLTLEVTRSRKGRLGERTKLSWNALYPQLPSHHRYREPGESAPRVRAVPAGSDKAPGARCEGLARVLAMPKFDVPERERKNAMSRDAYGIHGIHGFTKQRPGRDATRAVLTPLFAGGLERERARLRAEESGAEHGVESGAEHGA